MPYRARAPGHWQWLLPRCDPIFVMHELYRRKPALNRDQDRWHAERIQAFPDNVLFYQRKAPEPAESQAPVKAVFQVALFYCYWWSLVSPLYSSHSRFLFYLWAIC